jgi:homocysteine S-methyltransferase
MTQVPWEQHLGEIVLDTARRRRWQTILVGGCCKATYSDIARLVDYIHSADRS